MAVQGHADEHGRSGEAADYYRILQIDPDAPHDLVVEAYWHSTARLRAQETARQTAQQALASLNAAYAVLGVPERRVTYNASLKRLAERRAAREARMEAERLKAKRPTPLIDRLLGRPADDPSDPEPLDYYEILGVDPRADANLIARVYTILQTRPAQGKIASPPCEHRAYLEEAYSVLIDEERRAAYDAQRHEAATKQPALAAEVDKAALHVGAKTTTKTSKQPARRPEAVERTEATEEAEAAGGRRWLTLEEAAAAVLDGAAVCARCGLRSASLAYQGAGWTAARGGQKTAGLAEACAGAVARWQERRREAREDVPADLLDRRLLRDSVPTHFHAHREAPNQRPGQARLVVEEFSGASRVVALQDKPVTLGRDRACDVRLKADGRLIAPAHAHLWFAGGRFVIRSMSPQHPTLVAGQRVNWAMLDDGDEIVIGRCRIRFESAAPGDKPPNYLRIEPSPVGTEPLERQD